jgi:hypothetical protein
MERTSRTLAVGAGGPRAGESSLRAGKSQGTAPFSGKSAPKSPWIPGSCGKIPCAFEQGIFCAEQGMRREFFAPRRKFRADGKNADLPDPNKRYDFVDNALERASRRVQSLASKGASASPQTPTSEAKSAPA